MDIVICAIEQLRTRDLKKYYYPAKAIVQRFLIAKTNERKLILLCKCGCQG